MHNAGMANVTIRDVPDDVHSALLARAAEAGQSLQAYLQGLLATSVARPTVASFTQEMLVRARERTTRSASRSPEIDAVTLIRLDRDSSGRVRR